jgi:RNA polymerase sigma-70 factor (ECF subfamily)
LQNERQKFLSEALQKLPDIFREAVILCDIEGLSYEEISTVLEINPGTVKSRIARGREELRKKLKDF